MYTCKYKILADFNLAIARQTAKLPNLIPCQIFRLCGMWDKKLHTSPQNANPVYVYCLQVMVNLMYSSSTTKV